MPKPSPASRRISASPTMVSASIFKRILLLAPLVCLALGSALAGESLPSATLVLFNSNDPESAELARYYAGRRNIPPDQLVGLACPASEEISRADFERTIAIPLREKMESNGWWKTVRVPNNKKSVVQTTIRFVAIMRGMPLKIAADPLIRPPADTRNIPPAISSRNDASVDSEIAALGMTDWTPASVVENPYFGRFTQILDDSVFPGMLLPARLDAPTGSIVRAMIDDSLMAEKEGLWGWAYIDGRDITSGGYTEGDNWMRHLVEILRQRGVPTIFDNFPTTIADDFPVTDAAVYFGWYAGDACGPFARQEFQFKPGAVAVHLHSYSASTLRSTTSNWCGPLLARGAAATLGNVYEPYLSLTANLDVFQDRLMSGLTLAESAYMSMRALSWMGVVIGDPLYRPYAVWNQFYDPRNRPPNPWRRFRSITLDAKGNILDAVLPLYEAARETGNGMFLEALGAAQFDAHEAPASVHSFQSALTFTTDPGVRRRLDLETAAAKRRVEVVGAGTQVALEPLPTMPDSRIPAENGAAQDSSLVKPPPVLPKIPAEIPNLPYPDL
ncbi:MAG: TIGR03790 family protein [Spartobacteria bacterium]